MHHNQVYRHIQVVSSGVNLFVAIKESALAEEFV